MPDDTTENLRERIAWLRDRWYQRPGLSEQADALDAALDEFADDVPITAPVTAEDLARLFHDTYERLAPDHGYETRQDSAVPWENVPAANKSLMIAVAGRVLAALAGDPGDLPARMAEAIDATWTSEEDFDAEKAAAAAMSVRWEHAAAQSAEVERLRAELAEVKAERDTNFSLVGRLSTGGFACATQLELMTDERDALKSAIADVRRLCDMTIATSCRVQAIDQATDTLAVLDRALAVPESHEDAPTETADRLATHRDVMVASVQEAAIYLDAWGAELTALQAGSVVDALLDAVRKAETLRPPRTLARAERTDR